MRRQRYLYKELKLSEVQIQALKIKIQRPAGPGDDQKPTVRTLELSNNNISVYSGNEIPALEELRLDNNDLIQFTNNYFPQASTFTFSGNSRL